MDIENDTSQSNRQKRKPSKLLVLLLLIGVVGLVSTQLTIYSIPPIGAIPNGVTAITLRHEGGHFIDSPDAVCQRKTGGVSIMCRAMAMSAVAKNDAVLFKLPYMKPLYEASLN